MPEIKNIPETFDYDALGLMVGLEIHQQLASRTKLHCRCPNRIRSEAESNFEFFRYLRPKSNRAGVIDPAAIEQTLAQRPCIYKSYDSVCLGEMDEDVPSPLDTESLDIALTVSKLLHMVPVDTVHVMRKIIVDGSSPTGFQRTSFISGSGFIETQYGRCGIATLSLEEDSATSLGSSDDWLKFSLDRLGIPLIEIATEPDMRTPRQVFEVASKIGMILRSTGKVKRGIGTIRQDVNVSIRDGARVEMKGVQALDMIEEIVNREILRQISLLRLRDDLLKRNASVSGTVEDVTELFQNTKSNVLRKGIKSGKILATVLTGFNGHVGREIQPGRRLGTELSDKAKAVGVSGLFHTDELPNYGITENEVTNLRKIVGAGPEDAVVIMAGPPGTVDRAVQSVIERAKYALIGVPGETRYARADGNSSYMRPLPGPARMYPETDVLPVSIPRSYYEQLPLPELLSEKYSRFMSKYKLNGEFAEQMAYSHDPDAFELLAQQFSSSKDVTPTYIARNLTGTVSELKRSGCDTSYLSYDVFKKAFEMVDMGQISKDCIFELFEAYCKNPEKLLSEIVSERSMEVIDLSEVEMFVARLVSEKKSFVQEKQMASIGPLMGPLMDQFRGRVDGKDANRILKSEIEKLLKN